MAVAPDTQIAFDLYGTLSGVSDSFRQLWDKGREEAAQASGSSGWGLAPVTPVATAAPAASVASAAPVAAPAPAPTAGSCFCGQCGGKNETGAAFCGQCGAKL